MQKVGCPMENLGDGTLPRFIDELVVTRPIATAPHLRIKLPEDSATTSKALVPQEPFSEDVNCERREPRHSIKNSMNFLRLLFPISAYLIWGSFTNLSPSQLEPKLGTRDLVNTATIERVEFGLLEEEMSFAGDNKSNGKDRLTTHSTRHGTGIVPQSSSLINLANVDYGDLSDKHTPFFWEIPGNGGALMRHLFSSCLNFLQESNEGDGTLGVQKKTLEKVDSNGRHYVNVDIWTQDEMRRSHDPSSVRRQLAEVIVSRDPHAVDVLFDSEHKGVMFALFRHPVDRAAHMYRSRSKHDPFFPPYASLEMYAKSSDAEENPLTRILANNFNGTLTEDHLEAAKEILHQRCVVGLFSDFDSSVKMFEEAFSWTRSVPQSNSCSGLKLRKRAPSIQKDSKEWQLLSLRNQFDIRLYEYVEKLYYERKSLQQKASILA